MQSAREEAKAMSDRAAALQEQLEAIKARLQEAHVAKESSATPSNEVRLAFEFVAASLVAFNRSLSRLCPVLVTDRGETIT